MIGSRYGTYKPNDLIPDGRQLLHSTVVLPSQRTSAYKRQHLAEVLMMSGFRFKQPHRWKTQRVIYPEGWSKLIRPNGTEEILDGKNNLRALLSRKSPDYSFFFTRFYFHVIVSDGWVTVTIYDNMRPFDKPWIRTVSHNHEEVKKQIERKHMNWLGEKIGRAVLLTKFPEFENYTSYWDDTDVSLQALNYSDDDFEKLLYGLLHHRRYTPKT